MMKSEWSGVAPPAPPDRPLGELFAELAGQTGTLVRQELQLAKAEMSAKARRVTRDAAVVAAGGALTHAGGFFVLAAVVLALGTLMPIWLAALLVGLLVVGAGYGVCRMGLRNLEQINLTPENTVATLEENKLWVKKELAR